MRFEEATAIVHYPLPVAPCTTLSTEPSKILTEDKPVAPVTSTTPVKTSEKPNATVSEEKLTSSTIGSSVAPPAANSTSLEHSKPLIPSPCQTKPTKTQRKKKVLRKKEDDPLLFKVCMVFTIFVMVVGLCFILYSIGSFALSMILSAPVDQELLFWDQHSPLDVPSQIPLPLHKACQDGDLDQMKLLIDQGFSPQRRLRTTIWDQDDHADALNLAHIACSYGHLHIIQWLESEYGNEMTKELTEHSKSSLWLAVKNDHPAVWQYLLRDTQYADSMQNWAKDMKYCMSEMLLSEGHAELIRNLVLEEDSHVAAPEPSGLSSLGMALKDNLELESIQWLALELDANLHNVGSIGLLQEASLPEAAAHYGRVDVLQWIYDSKVMPLFGDGDADINALQLHNYAATVGSEAVFQWILDRAHFEWLPLDPEARQAKLFRELSSPPVRRTFAGYAARYAPLRFTQWVHVTYPRLMDLVHAKQPNNSILHLLAAAHSNPCKILWYLSHVPGADWSSVDQKNATIMHYGAQTTDVSFFKWLVAQVPSDLLDAPDSHGIRPSFIVAYAGRLENLVHLIEDHKVDVNAKDAEGRTLLSYAIQGGQKDIIDYLVAKNASSYKTE